MSDYLDVFNSKDPASIAAHFHIPCLAITPDGVRHFSSREQIESLFSATLGELAALDFARSRWSSARIKLFGSRTAMAAMVAVRFDSSGGELERIGATYTLQKIDANWKFVTLIVHAPEIVDDFGGTQFPGSAP